MNQSGKKLKRKQKKRLRKIFFRAILTTLIVVAIGAGIFAFVYNKFLYNGQGGFLGSKDPDPINKTVAVFGVDEDGYRTDVMFVVNFNSETGKARIISIPRDTKVEWSNTMQQKMADLKGYSVSVSKINEMTSYVGIENICDFTIPEIEELLGVPIDNYVIVTINAFKEIVDAIGGVEVDVPVLNGEGLQYDDYAQGLHIHLSPGLQTLNGEQAEGLVRFRKGYAEGDVGRIKTQQLFLEAFAKKVTSPQIITKLPAIATTIMDTVTTDIKLTEALGYIPYLKSLETLNLEADIIPGEARYEGHKSYFIPDKEAIPNFVNEMLYGETQEEVGEITIDYNVSIEILNSTAIRGLAGKAKEELTQAGYKVNRIGNYTPDILEQTVIYAKDINKARQFLAYYEGAQIIEQVDQMEDIQIVLGNDSV